MSWQQIFVLSTFLLTNTSGDEIKTFKNKTSAVENIEYKTSINILDGETLEVTTEILDGEIIDISEINEPVIFIAKYLDSVYTWQLPDTQNHNASTLTKTLCSAGGYMNNSDEVDVTVLIVQHPDIINFKVSLRRAAFNIEKNLDYENSSLTANVTANAAARFRLKLEKGRDYIVNVSNQTEAVCSSVSILTTNTCQDPHFSNKFLKQQSMLELAAINIHSDDFPDHDYLDIVIAIKATDLGCTLNTSKVALAHRGHFMKIKISVRELDGTLWWISVLVVLAFYVLGIVLIFVVYIFGRKYDYEPDGYMGKMVNRISKRSNQSRTTSLQTIREDAPTNEANNCVREDPTTNEANNCQPKVEVENNTNSTTRMLTEGEDDVDGRDDTRIPTENIDVSNDDVDVEEHTDDGDLVSCFGKYRRTVKKWTKEDEVDAGEHTIDYIHKHKRTINENRLQNDNCVANNAIYHGKNSKDFKEVRDEMSKSYSWLTGLMGIFYTLPVLQLVLEYQNNFRDAGNQDICYFNFKCLYRVWYIEDFGHVLSNLSYIISGLIFWFIVRQRKVKYHEDVKKRKKSFNNPWNLGIPEQFGIYEALAIALIMEGILSSCYHICPTRRNFQFDTTFMYIIAMLLFLKVYQFRHPDITLKARIIFLLMSILLIIEVVSYFTAELFFWIMFWVITVGIVAYFVVHIVTLGTLTEKHAWTFDLSIVKDVCNKKWDDKMCLAKALFVILINVIISCVMAFFLQKPGVSRYLLLILMLNMAMYIIYYIAKKIIYCYRQKDCYPREGLRKTTIAYLVMAMMFSCLAIYYFKFMVRKKSSVSPAESRNLNAECEVLIFDSHDLWHFFSGASIFFMFMFILTLEDRNIRVPRARLPVI